MNTASLGSHTRSGECSSSPGPHCPSMKRILFGGKLHEGVSCGYRHGLVFGGWRRAAFVLGRRWRSRRELGLRGRAGGGPEQSGSLEVHLSLSPGDERPVFESLCVLC